MGSVLVDVRIAIIDDNAGSVELMASALAHEGVESSPQQTRRTDSTSYCSAILRSCSQISSCRN